MATTEWELYRAIHSDSANFAKLDDVDAGKKGATANQLLHARATGKVQTGADGSQFVSAPDVTLERSDDDSPWYVLNDGGTSMHDVAGWFGYTTWAYFHVPQGTEYCDDTLFIKRDKKRKWNKHKTVKGRHYTIRPKNRMTLDAYFGALDNLARAAVVRSVALGSPSRVPSAAAADDASSSSSGA